MPHHHNETPAVELEVEGMHCQSCANTITKALENQGAEDIYVNFSTKEVRFQPGETCAIPEAINSIEKLGYKVKGMEQKEKGSKSFSTEFWFIFCAILSLPLVLHMFLPFHFLHLSLVQLFLSLPVVIFGWWYFGKSAWGSLRVMNPNMDVLIVTGFTAAFIYSLSGTLLNLGEDYLFYETASVIVTLVLLGNVLEHRSVKKTSSAIAELSKMQEVHAKRMMLSGEYETVHFNEIKVNDILLVNTGDKIPVDGIIVDGNAIVDESMISGESMPVEKVKLSKVTGGTINISGTFHLRAEQVGKYTVLSQIIELVKNAQQSKPQIQKLGDRVSAVFVPVVIGISALTFIISFAWVGLSLQQSILNGIAVLVISCPCAMGLATPTAVMVGIGRAAKNGILIKGGSTLEELSEVKTIIFDKTGTLTNGEFRIKQLVNYSGNKVSDDEIRSIIYSLEERSSHPIAKSLLSELRPYKSNLALEQITEEKGLGISGIDVLKNKYMLGSYSMMNNPDIKNNHQVYLLKNNELLGGLDLQDELKPSAEKAINALRQSGIRTILLSGDKKEKCEAIAKQLKIDEVYAEKLPQEKVALVEQRAKEGKVAMVGDGINDAPALTKANVGISLGNATQIAIQSSAVVLLNGDILKVSDALALSKQTVLTIKQNLFWAFFYNVVAIPVAAVGLLNPMIAALAMALSDVIVIGNSLRLKTKNLR